MGKHFGNLAYIRGIVYYKISQHEQKPFANAFSKGLPNMVPRTLATMYTWLPRKTSLTIFVVCCSNLFIHFLAIGTYITVTRN